MVGVVPAHGLISAKFNISKDAASKGSFRATSKTIKQSIVNAKTLSPDLMVHKQFRSHQTLAEKMP